MDSKDKQISHLIKMVEKLKQDNDRMIRIIGGGAKEDSAGKGVTRETSAEQTLFTVTQFSQKHRAFPVGGLRHIIFNEKTNGAKKYGVIVRVARKVYIDESKFFKWVEALNT